LVDKKSCLTDKRLVDVSITSKGMELLTRLDAKQNEMDALMGGLQEDEVMELNKLLDKIRK